MQTKINFLAAFKVFKYLFIAFSTIYWIYIIVDDFAFFKKWSDGLPDDWAILIGLQLAYYLIYSLVLAFCFWMIATVFVLARKV